jgi:cyclase
MLRTRIIPALLLRDECLVKTTKFSKFTYVGDPANTVRIFNELEVDELLFLDISASREKRKPNLKVLREIADECFMPLGYGGGIKTFDDAKAIFDIGFEKVAVNFSSFVNPQLISELSKHFGSQAVIASIDVKTTIFGRKQVYTLSGKKNTLKDPTDWAKQVEVLGAGEILLTSIDREGTWSGFDYDMVKEVADAVSIPVIAHGGASCIGDIQKVVKDSNASAVALGSMVVFQKKGMGVLINFPNFKM